MIYKLFSCSSEDAGKPIRARERVNERNTLPKFFDASRHCKVRENFAVVKARRKTKKTKNTCRLEVESIFDD